MGNRWRWASLVVVGAALVALLAVLVPSAFSSPGPDEYTAAITPNTVAANAPAPQTYTVTITNTGNSGDLGSANAQIGAGFTGAALVSSTLTGSGSENWTAQIASGTVQLRANSSGDALPPGDSVSVDVQASAPTTTGSYTWATAADGSITFDGTTPFNLTGSDAAVTVTPGPLDHFDISSSQTPGTPIGNQVAGKPFTIYVTAYDGFGNVKTDYPETNDAATVGGLQPSPAPTSRGADYPTLTFVNGVASGSVTAYLANDPLNGSDVSHLTVTDTGTGEGGGKTGTSSTFAVGPADIGSFDWTNSPASTQTAGHVFTTAPITVTAFDGYSNVKFDENTNNFSGLGASSPQGCSGPCPPVYGFSWSDGVASSSTVTAYVTGSNEQLTVTDGTISAPSGAFDVGPDSLDHFEFASIDNSHKAGDSIPVTLTAYDKFENVKTDYPQTNDHASLSGLAPSPAPVSQPPLYGSITWGSGTGIGSATVEAFKANDPLNATDLSQLTATDDGTGEGQGKTGSSNTFKVAPAGLDHFTFVTVSNQVAGTQFGVTVTARDQYANTEYDYSGSGTLSGLQNSPQPINKPAVYPSLSFAAGVASGNVTAYFANDPLNGLDNSQLRVDGGGKSGQSNTFKVAPAGLDHFTFATVNNQVAGTQFGVTVTARDQYANTEYDYSGSGTLSGLQNSPQPINKPPVYPLPSLSFAAGVASGNVKAFFANDPNNSSDTSHLDVSGSGKTGSSNTFKVAPAGLDHFIFANIGNQIAGTQFGVTVTGQDQYANTEYEFNGAGALSGLAKSPAPSNTPPVYPNPLGFTNGIGIGNVKAFFANNPNNSSDTSQLSISGGGKSGSSNTFKVQAANPATLTFTQQPNDTQPNPPSCNGSAVCQIATKIRDLDQYSNPEVGVTVNLKVDPSNNPGNDSLTALTAGECTLGTCSKQADNSGVATFTDLTMHNIATLYELLASSGPTVSPGPAATQQSAFLNVAQTVTKCNGNCTAHAADSFDNITATATGVGGDLSITLENKSIVGQCAGVTKQAGNVDTVNPTNATGSPTLEVTGTLIRKNNSGGIGNFIFCKNMGGNTPFHTVPLCKDTNPPNTPPCLKKLTGAGQGSVAFDLIVKATPDPNNPGQFIFDPKMGGGG